MKDDEQKVRKGEHETNGRKTKEEISILRIFLALFIFFTFVYIIIMIDNYTHRPHIDGKEEACEMQLHQIVLALLIRKIPPSPGDKLIPYVQDKRSDQYWWIEAVKPEFKCDDKGNLPEQLLYCATDTNRTYISSFISNPKVQLMEIEKIKDPKNTILLVEQGRFHKNGRHCIFADFSLRQIDEYEYKRLKDW